MTTKQPGYFVSDLHLFARRSHGERHTTEIREAARNARQFVLGGDIFDFKWSTLSSNKSSIDAAIRWLDELALPNPNCDIHFVLGNHDTHADFLPELDRLSADRVNFQWHPYHVRLDHNLFLHGDVADRRMNQKTLEKRRKRCLQPKRKGRWANLLYDAAIHANLHRVAAKLIHSKKRVATRLHAYLDDIGQGPHNGLRRVYFGHTHVPIVNYESRGLIFNNGGAPIKGMGFRIVKTEH